MVTAFIIGLGDTLIVAALTETGRSVLGGLAMLFLLVMVLGIFMQWYESRKKAAEQGKRDQETRPLMAWHENKAAERVRTAEKYDNGTPAERAAAVVEIARIQFDERRLQTRKRWGETAREYDLRMYELQKDFSEWLVTQFPDPPASTVRELSAFQDALAQGVQSVRKDEREREIAPLRDKANTIVKSYLAREAWMWPPMHVRTSGRAVPVTETQLMEADQFPAVLRDAIDSVSTDLLVACCNLPTMLRNTTRSSDDDRMDGETYTYDETGHQEAIFAAKRELQRRGLSRLV
jgi:hypothetical protein